MDIELHLSGTVLGEAVKTVVKDQILAQDLGVSGVFKLPYPNPMTGTQADVVVDHISVRSATLVRRRGSTAAINKISLPQTFPGLHTVPVQAQNIGIDAILEVAFARIDDLRVAGAEPIADKAFMPITVKIELNLGQPVISGDSLSISITADGIALGFGEAFCAPETLSDSARGIVERLNSPEMLGRFEIPPLSLNTSDLAETMGPGVRLWNAGLRRVSDALILRLQFEDATMVDTLGLLGGSWISRWTSFHSEARSRLHGQQWAMLLPEQMFTERISRTVEAALEHNEDLVINPANPPHSTWSVAQPAALAARERVPEIAVDCVVGGRAMVMTRFSAHAIDACKPFNMDIDVDLALPVEITMPRAGTLRVQLTVEYSLNAGDVFLCEVSGLLGGLIGVIVTAALTGSDASGSTPLGSGAAIRPVEGEENTYFTEISMALPNDRTIGKLHADVMLPCAHGLLIAGAVSPPQSSFSMLDRVEADDRFYWRLVSAACPPAGRLPVVVARATICGRRSRSQIPMVVYSATLLNAPKGYADAVNIHVRSDPNTYSVNLDLSAVAAQRLRGSSRAELEPLTVFIQTNAGARVITIAPIDESLTEEGYLALRDWQHRRCEAARRRKQDFERHAVELIEVLRERVGRIPEFTRDGPPGGFRWTVRAGGLDAGTEVQLGQLGQSGFIVDHALTADSRGNVAARVWQLRTESEPRLAMHIGASGHKREGGREAGREGGEAGADRVGVSLTYYAGAAVLESQSAIRDQQLFTVDGVLCLAVVCARGVTLYDLELPAKPHVVRRLRLSGLRSSAVTRHGLVLWGPGGAHVLSRAGVLATLTGGCVTRVEVSRDLLGVTTVAGVGWFGHDGTKLEPVGLGKRRLSHGGSRRPDRLGAGASECRGVAVLREPGCSLLRIVERDLTL